MDLRNCSECGKLFVYVGRDLCPECVKTEEEMFEKVEKFLRKNSGASVQEISEATGVPEEKIIHFLKEGRLVARTPFQQVICERCGKPIASGRFCGDCLEALRATVGTLASPALKPKLGKEEEQSYHFRPVKGEKGRMYTAERLRRWRSED